VYVGGKDPKRFVCRLAEGNQDLDTTLSQLADTEEGQAASKEELQVNTRSSFQ
jgi:hypothetical protein